MIPYCCIFTIRFYFQQMIDYHNRLRTLVSKLGVDITHIYHQFSDTTQQRLAALQAVKDALPNFKDTIEDGDEFLIIHFLNIDEKVC